MKVKCNRAALHEAVQLASSIVPARTPKEILKCAKLQTEDDQSLYVIATDNDITINYRVPQIEIEQHGQLALPADRLAKILNEFSDDVVRLELDDSACQVYGKDSHFMIYGFDPDDFPDAVIGDFADQFEIQAGVLRRMIRMTSFAVAKESSRYAINGVLWEHKGKKVRMVGTDGRRLAVMDGMVLKSAAESGEESQGSIIVPVKVLQTIERVLVDPEEKVRLCFTDKKVIIATSLARISGTLVQGRYPNYEDVIPTGAQNKASMLSADLLSAVRQVSLLVNETSRGVRMDLTHDHLHLSSSTPEAGDAEVDMAIKYDGQDMTIGFNPVYMIEALRAVEEPEVNFEFIDGNRPGIMRVGKDYLYVIMPVNV